MLSFLDQWIVAKWEIATYTICWFRAWIICSLLQSTGPTLKIWPRSWHCSRIFEMSYHHSITITALGWWEWAAVYGVTQSRTRLKQLSMHACIGEGNGNPLQYSCLENARDGGAWWAAIYRVTQSWTWLKRLNSNSEFHDQGPIAPLLLPWREWKLTLDMDLSSCIEFFCQKYHQWTYKMFYSLAPYSTQLLIKELISWQKKWSNGPLVMISICHQLAGWSSQEMVLCCRYSVGLWCWQIGNSTVTVIRSALMKSSPYYWV